MKKVININFQGRVIPIEESAFEMLKGYTDSLRRCFANEEGRDEIINDIESRIAELFGEALKKGSVCITDSQVNTIIDNMGRPEELNQDEPGLNPGAASQHQSATANDAQNMPPYRDKLFRDNNDKFLGGVCGGLAHYFKLDPAIIRVAFALATIGWGSGIILYILLWIILPSRTLAGIASTKRLYRNPDEKVIAGVASGIASYFDIAIWIPRIIFALPLVFGILSSFLNKYFHWFYNHESFSKIVFSSFGGTLLVIYAVLWAIIPEAKSATEKLEMRGEKVDLNSIKNTIQEDLQGFKSRAEKWGKDVSEKAQQMGEEVTQTVKETSANVVNETRPIAKSGISRLANAIGILFKAFFMFIGGVISLALLAALVAILFAGASVFPLKDFVLDSAPQQVLAWLFLLLFFGIPIIAFITAFIRRIMGVKSGNNYLGYTFAGLWVIGLVSGIFLLAGFSKHFEVKAREKQEYAIAQPSNGKLLVTVADSEISTTTISSGIKVSGLLRIDGDSLQLSNISVHVEKSNDSLYHVTGTRLSNGKDGEEARKNLVNIQYGFTQQDSVLKLNRGIHLAPNAKFRNQQLVLTIQVPVGKKIQIDRSVRNRFFFLNIADNEDGDDWSDFETKNNWRTGVEYEMTQEGLKRTGNTDNLKSWDGDKEDETNPMQDYRKSRRQLENELEKKNRELDEIKKELEKPAEPKKVALHTVPSDKKAFFYWFQSANSNSAVIREDKVAAAAYIFYHKLI
ncbi:MAG: PspC domain-containing protein [Chitinophagia bacterium]|jgi:phage shock protein PspC (stress-responsive transcriptional regulator)